MAKDAQFKVYDLQRKNPSKLPSPPVKIHQSRLDPGVWARATRDQATGGLKPAKVGKTRGRAAKRRPAAKLPKRAIDVLRYAAADETLCLHCGNFGDDASCGHKCYLEYKKQFIGDKVDIRGPGPLGYMAFTKPGVRLAKGQILGEYVGDLVPLGTASDATNQFYRFEIPEACCVDASQSGNWTRFINSHCTPNVEPVPGFVGGRHAIIFEAKKNIGPEEQLMFDYGLHYFKNAKMKCKCDKFDEPHMPGQAPVKRRTSARLAARR